VVEVYIRYLRKKVDEPFSSPLIHTVRGVGYELRPGP
jgi:two-component system, OmpR family, response regulator ArlR